MATKKELHRRLDTIAEMIEERFRNKKDMLASTMNLLMSIREVAKGRELAKKPKTIQKAEDLATTTLDHVVISCDASIKENPGGPASVGFVIRRPNEKPTVIGRPSPATSNNQAEYDAVYEALTTFFNLSNNPGCTVEVRSDSKLVIDQLNGEMKCHDKDLARRRDLILEYVKALPAPINFVWMPRNSTEDLAAANFKAQALLGVRKH